MKEKIEKVLKTNNFYDIMKLDKKERDKILRKIMQIDDVSVLQVSRITGVPYHLLRYLE